MDDRKERTIPRLLGRLKENSRKRWPWIVLIIVVLVSIFTRAVTGELRWEYGVSVLMLWLPAWFGGRRGIEWSQLLFLLWIPAVWYLNFRLFAPYRLTPVHVADLYEMEKQWFGLDVENSRMILSEWFAAHHHPALDLLAGLAYIFYVYQPLAILAILFFRYPIQARRLAWAFMTVNMLGIATYILYPAAPPWYVADYGFGPPRMDAPASPAGAARFDALVGVRYFEHLYARSENVFGAVPSLHAAYPMVVFLCVAGLGRLWSITMLGTVFWIGFSAVYLQHHYLLDVLVGYLYAGLAVGVVYGIERRRGAGAQT